MRMNYILQNIQKYGQLIQCQIIFVGKSLFLFLVKPHAEVIHLTDFVQGKRKHIALKKIA